MKVLGIIPARYASSRFPGKPLIDLKGKSMIQRVYEGASGSKFIDQLVVATDDQRIVEHVQNFGGMALLTADHHQSGTERCAEVLATFPHYDLVLNIQGDEPLVDPRQLDTLLAAFDNPSVKIATLVSPTVSAADLSNPNRIKVVANAKQEALYFSRSAIPNQHHASDEQLKNHSFLRHIGLYAYRTETLLELVKLDPTSLEKIESLEQLRWLYYGYQLKLVETHIETPNIDVPDDVAEVLRFL
ncbi:MAG: 3-deoxy-manno-octulosonate cytidylyltransferase [Bacteroidota bacterium]|jgi:3-deoxy-manno-octulosonate cytidylyltransferase (CMP-KDO synthetase)